MALALHWPSVEWGLRHISSAELTEWLVYIELEGLPEMNAEIRAARSLQFFVNAHRDPKSTSGDYELKDFLPEWVFMNEKLETEEGGPEVDPATEKRAAEKMLSLGNIFR